MDHYVYSGLARKHQTIVQSVLNKDVSAIVLEAIHKTLGVTPDQARSKKRNREFCDARQMYFALLRRSTDLSLDKIGRTVNRHHSTVVNSIHVHNDKMQFDKAYKAAYMELCSTISTLIKEKHAKEED
jgi:chromosomal replication initiator protein